MIPFRLLRPIFRSSALPATAGHPIPSQPSATIRCMGADPPISRSSTTIPETSSPLGRKYWPQDFYRPQSTAQRHAHGLSAGPPVVPDDDGIVDSCRDTVSKGAEMNANTLDCRCSLETPSRTPERIGPAAPWALVTWPNWRRVPSPSRV